MGHGTPGGSVSAAVAACAVLLVFASGCYPFEVDGLTSGMSMESARKVLAAASYKNIQARENGIIASGANRLILLSFCKGELVLVQKQLAPTFDTFIRLTDEMRKERGKPADAWGEPADGNLPVEKNAISVLWKDSLTSVKITYTEFASNKQLDVIHETRNACRQILD